MVLRAIKLSVCQLALRGWKILYKKVLGLLVESQTRPLSGSFIALEATSSSSLGLVNGLLFLPWAFLKLVLFHESKKT